MFRCDLCGETDCECDLRGLIDEDIPTNGELEGEGEEGLEY
jgi:hypothetical protein